MQKLEQEHQIEIGTLDPNGYSTYDISLPLSLDSTNYPQLKLINIKAWYLFMSIVRESTPEEYQAGICVYTFPSLEFAKMMNMKQPRGRTTAEALKVLANIPIQIVEADGVAVDEDVDLTYVHLIMRIRYSGKAKKKPITIWLDPIVNDLIFHSRQIINFAYEDIARLSTVASIHVFTILWRLHLQHIHVISLQDLKNKLRLGNSYARFKDFARVYLIQTEADIRTNTSFKNFHFTYDKEVFTGRHASAEGMIQFTFSSAKQLEEKEQVTANLADTLNSDFRKKAASFDTMTQELLFELGEKGYAVNTYMNLILKVISTCSETAFRTCALNVLWEAQRKNETLKYKYGKILTKDLKELLKHKSKAKELVRDAVKRHSFQDQQALMQSYYQRAKANALKMTVDERQTLLRQYPVSIKRYMKDESKFRERDILTAKPDARKASYKAFLTFLAEAYRTGMIALPTKLFD